MNKINEMNPLFKKNKQRFQIFYYLCFRQIHKELKKPANLIYFF